ncbi:Peptidase family M28 protein [Rhizoctonia solani]|uniref:Peptide hydrolase n=1 Tax=Rhizoctonia solani TaxID=456999 RepID=A0A8H8NSX1_9AGAM|nr:Peptidase family M28 protein [Rhizoctonia solani]QRW18183.1 Peptidase family M28 protein [Rhizoctonia solani]
MVRLAPLAVAASLTSCACASFIDDTINALKLPLSSEKLQNDIKLPALKTHAKLLQSFADKSNGTRVFGSKGHNSSVDYVATIAKLAGYDVQRQTFPHEYSEVLTQKFVANAPININAMTYSPSTPLGGITVPLVLIPGPDAAPSAGCTPADFASVDAKGKIALIQRGGCNFAIKNENAKNAGAVGVVVYNNVEGAISGTLGASNPTAYVPIGGITKAEGETLAQRLSSGQPISATLDINIFVEQRYSSNVIATSKAGNQSNIVFIGSHLDSVTAGAGINDNGSGSITVLELAIQLAKYKLKNAVRFAWWTAEEYGLVGSDPNYVIAVYDGDGSAGINPGPTPPGSGAIEKVFTDYFKSKKIPSVPTEFSGRSDYGPFIAEGVNIPAGGLFTGAEGVKTEEQAKLFSGTAGVAYDVNYHGKGDTYSNLNFTAFEINAKASAHAIATFIQSTKVVDDEKATAGASPKVAAKIAAEPNDALVAQGKDLCAGELA